MGKETGHPNLREPKSAASKKRGVRGKSTDPGYVKLTSYIRRETHLAVKKQLLDEEMESSELVQELLVTWLKSRSR